MAVHSTAPKAKKTPRYVPARVLKERGWTDDMIKLHHFERDDRGWSIAKAEQIEATEEWQADRDRAEAGLPVTYRRKEILTERPWTEAMATEFMPEPDIVIKFGTDKRVFLYCARRVEAIEASEAFRERAAKAAARSAKAHQAAEHRIEAEWLEFEDSRPDFTDRIRLKKVSEDEIDAAVADAYDSHQGDPAHADRLAVNFLRHECTNYDSLIWQVDDKIKLRHDVLRKIAEAHPHLELECERQDYQPLVEEQRDFARFERDVRAARWSSLTDDTNA